MAEEEWVSRENKSTSRVVKLVGGAKKESSADIPFEAKIGNCLFWLERCMYYLHILREDQVQLAARSNTKHLKALHDRLGHLFAHMDETCPKWRHVFSLKEAGDVLQDGAPEEDYVFRSVASLDASAVKGGDDDDDEEFSDFGLFRMETAPGTEDVSVSLA